MIVGLVLSKCDIAFNFSGLHVYGKRFYDMYWDMVLRLVLLGLRLSIFSSLEFYKT